MTDILHKITINAPQEKVYAALSSVDGLANWWTSTTSGESAVGKQLDFRFNQHLISMRVKELVAGKRVAWESVASGSEWDGTQVTFDLTEEAGRTTLLFGHRAWKEPTAFMAHCSMKWAVFMLSLRDLAVTGQGMPFPRDIAV